MTTLPYSVSVPVSSSNDVQEAVSAEPSSVSAETGIPVYCGRALTHSDSVITAAVSKDLIRFIDFSFCLRRRQPVQNTQAAISLRDNGIMKLGDH